MMRLFIAITPSGEQREELGRLQQRLGSTLEGVKWVAPPSLHLTLKFLGELEESRRTAITAAMRGCARGAAPFALRFGGAGVFPSMRRARVIWTAVKEGTGEVSALAAALEAELVKRGFPAESRPFRAHLTLGRIRRPLPAGVLERLLKEESPFSTGVTVVRSLSLYRSHLSPRGASYSALEEIYLADNRGK
jgi:2'-5' RNA ligase